MGRGEGFKQIELLFHEVVDKYLEEQQVFLEHLKLEDFDTYQLLKTLLEADDSPNPIFGNSPLNLIDDWSHDPDLVGERIGSFRLVEIVGQGAMGSVFRAERADGQFEQTVAIKLLKSQMLNSRHREFFDRERQILAKLNHPGIARLYDGGFTESGRPFFTMEWISGQSLTAFARASSKNLQQRIDLFLQICDAVKYAHQSLIAHLDLKPANIIVDENERVKLLDFGVSKLLKDNLDEAGSFTLPYASPEQVKRESTNSVSDIYSLGVILFELLVDHHPFQAYFQDLAKLKEKILSNEYAQFVLADLEGKPAFSDDLRWICQKAMAQEISDRYGSVDELIGDLKAFRSSYPISLRRNDWKYVGRKYFQRNRKILAVIGIGIIALIGTGTFYTVQVQEQRDIAEAEAKKANQITELLTDVFMAADPNVGGADTITAVNLLDQGMLKLEKNLADDPEMYAGMLVRFSSIYFNLGQYEKGKALAEEAYLLGAEARKISDGMFAYTEHQLGSTMYYYGELDSAEVLLLRAINRHLEAGSDIEKLTLSLVELGTVYHDLGQMVKADSLYRMCYENYLTIREAPDTDLAFTLHMLGSTSRDLGDFEKAEDYFMRALAMKKELFEEPHLEIAYTYNFLGSLYQSTREYEKSLDYINSSYEQRLAILGKYHPETMASLSNTGRVYNRMERFEEAKEVYTETLEIVDSLFGKTHHYYAGVLGNLSAAVAGLGEYEEAKEMLFEVQKLMQELNPSNQLTQVPPLLKLGEIAEKQNDLPLAKKYFEDALAIRVEALPEGHFQIAQSQQALGECLISLGDYSTAIEYLELAYEIFQSQPEVDEVAMASVGNSLITAFEGINDKEKANYYQELLAARE